MGKTIICGRNNEKISNIIILPDEKLTKNMPRRDYHPCHYSYYYFNKIPKIYSDQRH